MGDRSLFPGLIISLRRLADIAREAAKSAHTRLPAAHSHRSSAASLADLRHRFRAWSRLVAEKRTGPSFTSNFAALSMSPVSGAKMSPSSQVSNWPVMPQRAKRESYPAWAFCLLIEHRPVRPVGLRAVKLARELVPA